MNIVECFIINLQPLVINFYSKLSVLASFSILFKIKKLTKTPAPYLFSAQ